MQSMNDERSSKKVDWLTVSAIAIIAYAALNITHEIIGHCGMALLMGTKCTVLSTTYVPLDPFPPAWKYRIIVVAGCTANFIAAIVSLGLLHRLRERSSAPDGTRPLTQAVLTTGSSRSGQPALRYFFWLLMSVNLFLASTYIAVAPIIKFGDSYLLIQDLPRQMFLRPAVAAVGAILWILSLLLCRVELVRLVGVGGRAACRVALKLVVPAYLTGGIVTVASAFFSRLDWKIAQLEAAGGTLGLTIWLLLLPFLISRTTTNGPERFAIPRSIAWIVAGALTALVFIGVWGRGIVV